MGAGCVGIDQNSVSIIEPVDGDTSVTSVKVVEPSGDDSSSITSISTFKGVIEVGRFYGTEMACTFSDDAEIGARRRCNYGIGIAMGIRTDDDSFVWLKDYRCDATEFIVKEQDGIVTEYETSNCDGGVTPGDMYLIDGVLEERKDQWYGGKQQDELWMTVGSIEQIN